MEEPRGRRVGRRRMRVPWSGAGTAPPSVGQPQPYGEDPRMPGRAGEADHRGVGGVRVPHLRPHPAAPCRPTGAAWPRSPQHRFLRASRTRARPPRGPWQTTPARSADRRRRARPGGPGGAPRTDAAEVREARRRVGQDVERDEFPVGSGGLKPISTDVGVAAPAGPAPERTASGGRRRDRPTQGRRRRTRRRPAPGQDSIRPLAPATRRPPCRGPRMASPAHAQHDKPFAATDRLRSWPQSARIGLDTLAFPESPVAGGLQLTVCGR